jgi:Histidine kinase/Histidine kinase-, DNA gyrase B-, and HSP90-like ATPase
VAEHELNDDGPLMVGASAGTGRLAAVCGTRPEPNARPEPRSRLPVIRRPEPIIHARRGGSRERSARGVDERRQLARDLHDGVQAELVSLLIRLKQAEEHPDTPPQLAQTFAVLGDHTTAALASVREIVLGIYPPALTRSGVTEALRAQAARASTTVIVSGTAPRSTDDAEAAVYFSCSEAIQNVAKHAGRDTRVTVSLAHDHGMLAVRVQDDGQGFDPVPVQEGPGLGNIRDRIDTLGGDVELESRPGRGTVLTLSLPWPRRRPNTAPCHRDPHKPGRLRVLMLGLAAAAGAISSHAGQTKIAGMVVAIGLAAPAVVLGLTDGPRRHREAARRALWRLAARASSSCRGLTRARTPTASQLDPSIGARP